VRDQQDSGLNIFLDLPAGGQFECSDSENCDVSVSFDGAPVETYSASTPNDGSDDTIFLDSESELLAKIKASRRAVFEVVFYRAGTQQLTFSLAGLRWAGGANAAASPPSSPGGNTAAALPPPLVTWTTQPTSDDIIIAYPWTAQQIGTRGLAVLRCTVDAAGVVGSCSVVREDPPGFEFGAAALRLARLYRAAARPNGQPIEVDIPIHFSLPASYGGK
jgi:TonB family protein